MQREASAWPCFWVRVEQLSPLLLTSNPLHAHPLDLAALVQPRRALTQSFPVSELTFRPSILQHPAYFLQMLHQLLERVELGARDNLSEQPNDFESDLTGADELSVGGRRGSAKELE